MAVPYGVCTEPSNVKAGGGACPFRFRCAGCDHFRTDVSYLPDLHAYLDDLLRNRERLLAATDIDDWARAEAMPSEEEIARIRSLIGRIIAGLDDLDPADRAQHRPGRRGRPGPSCGCCRHAPGAPCPRRPSTPPATVSTPGSGRVAAMVEGRRAETERHRQQVLAAITAASAEGEAITVAGIARRAGVDRTFFYRHRDLLDHIHALAAQPPNPDPGAVSRASLQADLHAAQARCARYAARVQQLERRLSEPIGEQTWRTSGLGAPDDIDQLHQRITALAAEVADVRIQLGERTDELHAAWLANRELMTRLNLPRPTG